MAIDKIVVELMCAAEKLSETTDSRINPVGGISLGYALSSARSPEDVAVVVSGQVLSHSDHPIARMVLTAIRFDPTIRSVGVIRYSPEALLACKSLLLEVCSFDRAREPPGGSSIDFGVAFCCERTEGIPDIIYDTGTPQKEALIRILGDNPGVVSGSINRILTRIINTNPIEE